jgi:5'-phosphate synthase pdxT subunit
VASSSTQKVITELLPTAHHEPPIEVISRIPESLLPRPATTITTTPDATDEGIAQTVVALRQGRHLLTTFHPELTGDNRFHEYFVQECVIPSLAS